MTVDAVARPRAGQRPGHVPGEPGLWVLVFGDLLVFGVFFVMILALRGQDPAGFVAAQQTLHVEWGVLNTIVLLTSSLFVVLGVRRAGERDPRAPRLLLAAVACGLIFAGVKAIEYTTLVQDGHRPAGDEFHAYYFMFTGVHLAHVLIGMTALLFAARLARPSFTGPHRNGALEGIATFWHLVDLLWIMLFATLYLMH